MSSDEYFLENDVSFSQQAKVVDNICHTLLNTFRGSEFTNSDKSNSPILAKLLQQLAAFTAKNVPEQALKKELLNGELGEAAREAMHFLMAEEKNNEYSSVSVEKARDGLTNLIQAFSILRRDEEAPRFLDEDLDKYAKKKNIFASLDKTDHRISKLESMFDESELMSLVQEARNQVEDVNRHHSMMRAKVHEVEDKAEESIDAINDSVSKDTKAKVAREYIDNAETEGKLASKYRKYSLWCMFASVAFLLVTVFFPPTVKTTQNNPIAVAAVAAAAETDKAAGSAKAPSKPTPSASEAKAVQPVVTTESVDPWQAGLRIMLSLLLSVPAAYLARESSKHRIQQNAYLQIAMNVGAVRKLVGNLDKEVQNQIIGEMAHKLFTNPVGVGQNGNATDPYPINSGELLMKMMDKMDFKKQAQGSGADTDQKP